MSVLSKIKGSFYLNIIQIFSVVSINLILVKKFGVENLDIYYYLQVVFQLLFFATSSVLFNSLLSLKKNLKNELIFLTFLFLLLSPIILFINYSGDLFNLDDKNISLFNSMFFLWLIRGYVHYLLNSLKLYNINRFTKIEIIELSIVCILFFVLSFESIVSYIYLMTSSKFFMLLLLFYNIEWKKQIEKYSYLIYFKNFIILYISNFTGYIYSFSERTFLLNLDTGILTLFTLAQKFVNPVTSIISGSNNLIVIFKTQLKENNKFLKSILSFNINISISISIILILIVDFLPQFLFDFISIKPLQKNTFIIITKFLIISIPFSSAIVIYKKYLLGAGQIKLISIMSFISALLQLIMLVSLPINGVYKIITLLAITTIIICLVFHTLIFNFSYYKINLFLWTIFITFSLILDQFWLSLISGLLILIYNINEVFTQKNKLQLIE